MIPFVAPPRGRGLGLSLRLALRELRAGFGGFRVFLACLALGVAAIGGVGSVATSLSDALTREGRTILGGDVAFSLIHREASAEERAFLQGQGAVAVAATTRAMVRTAAGGATLVELKAVDGAYPLVGAVETDPPAGFQADLAERDGRFGAVADPALLARLGVGVGDPLTVGSATLDIRAKLVKEPDALSGGLGFGPRLFISEAALRATGLIQPGSLMRWSYRVALPGGASADPQPLVEAAKARFPDAGWQVRTRDKASAQLARNAEQFTQYLTFVGLTALLVGGVGVANAVGAYVARKRESIATLSRR
jgi:putative ABC transport system permease protein